MRLTADLILSHEVITTGHSLGAAIATLDAMYLKLHMPSLDVKNRVFASPRVGNFAFASYFPTLVGTEGSRPILWVRKLTLSSGRQVPDSFHMVNKLDIIPHLAPLLLGFEHIPGEVSLIRSLSI